MKDIEIIETPLHLWGVAIGIAIAAGLLFFVAMRILKRCFNGRNLFLDLLEKTHAWFIVLLSLYLGTFILKLPLEMVGWPFRILACGLAIQGGIWMREIIFFYLRRYRVLGLDEEVITSGSVAAINFVVNLVLWSVVAVFLLSNIGFDVTALVTGLGVGGIAVALAVQNILGDLFSSLSIVMDKPFKIGDVILVGEFTGTVENIGMKTTRLRSLSGEIVVFSNSDLLNCRIRNFKQMKKRRAVFPLGIMMDTSIEKVERVPDIVRSIIEPREKLVFDRAHFKNIGDFAYEFEVVYYLQNPDMVFYLDNQQAINLEILRRFKDEGIEFAYPTSTVNLSRESL